MSKWFSVTVTALKVCLVEVEDNEGADEATQIAVDEAFCGCVNVETDKTEEVAPDALDSHLRHADETYSL